VIAGPTLKRASNSFKHGLYAKKLTYSTPADHQLYADILHDYVHHYRPITPDEETLVQQLAALQFRHLKVQTFQADSMRAEVLRQCQNAPPEADGSMPNETAIETRAFEALCERAAFRLYLQELNRLPNKIQRTIDRIHLLIRLRPEVAAWSKPQPLAEPIAPAPPVPAAEPMEIQPGEETPQTEETKNWPTPITSKEQLIEWWNEKLSAASQQILLHGEKNGEGRQAFFKMCRLPEPQFWAWLKEAFNEGRIKLPQRRYQSAA
jgi:hypothetical protein